jgi:translation initiation factor 2B subunit (eIF-2B alpha/beta/delta family)
MGTSSIRSHRDTAGKIEILREEIEVFRSRIEEHDTGHLYTTISTLEHRIEELEKESKELISKGYMSSYE